eukprot:m.194079 g.194079  ORF g.194079 m.194079 type:complete len:332 (-) comp21775_c2_seq1:81-1076(-)
MLLFASVNGTAAQANIFGQAAGQRQVSLHRGPLAAPLANATSTTFDSTSSFSVELLNVTASSIHIAAIPCSLQVLGTTDGVGFDNKAQMHTNIYAHGYNETIGGNGDLMVEVYFRSATSPTSARRLVLSGAPGEFSYTGEPECEDILMDARAVVSGFSTQPVACSFSTAHRLTMRLAPSDPVIEQVAVEAWDGTQLQLAVHVQAPQELGSCAANNTYVLSVLSTDVSQPARITPFTMQQARGATTKVIATFDTYLEGTVSVLASFEVDNLHGDSKTTYLTTTVSLNRSSSSRISTGAIAGIAVGSVVFVAVVVAVAIRRRFWVRSSYSQFD